MFDGTLGNYTGTEYKIELLKIASTVPCKTISYSTNAWKNSKNKSKQNSEWTANRFEIGDSLQQ